MRVRGVGVWVTLIVLLITLSSLSAYAEDFGYSTVNPPPGTEKTHAEILEDIYDQTFTASGENYIGSGSITAYRVYDFDDIFYNTTHVYNHVEYDVDQIWTDGAVTVTAYARYAAYEQTFGWNGGGTEGTNFIDLVDYTDIDNGGVSFQITEGQQFLWGLQVSGDGRCTGYYEEWWSLQSENDWCNEEDHMVTYYMEGAGVDEAVWTVFWEDVKFGDGSDRDYNDFVVEIRAIPEPTTVVLLGIGALLVRRRRRA